MTQFELLTAAAFVAFAAARVQYAVIEAGLGGRLDATNVIPSQLTVLTSVGYDHTEWLGETLQEIAAEKVAVLRGHTTLLVGQVPEQVNEVIDREVAVKHARKLWATSVANNMVPGYQGRNLALAQAAAGQVLGELDSTALVEFIKRLATREFSIRGRAELVPGDPPAIFDAAHNPDGAIALAEALPDLARGATWSAAWRCSRGRTRPGSWTGSLRPARASSVPRSRPRASRDPGGPEGRARPALELAALCDRAGVPAEAIADPIEAWERARQLAKARNGVALAAGSHYLLSCIWTERPAQSS